MATQTHGEAARSGAGRTAKRDDRTTPPVFVRQVVSELRKVNWPTRNTLVTYTIACLVFVVVMATIVTLLDVGFAKLMFEIF
jgi:preprotein translocase subunit SecE